MITERKTGGVDTCLQWILGSLPVLLSLVFTVILLAAIVLLPVDRPEIQRGSVLGTVEKYSKNMMNAMADTMNGVMSIKKQYWISQDARCGPVPNPSCFGEAESPGELNRLIEDARELLDGQELYFSGETQLLEGSKIHYYLDETILAITWKQSINKTVYTFSEVKIVHPSQFRRFLSDGTFNSGRLYLTTEMAESVNAVVAGSGDYYAYRSEGITVTDGILHRANPGIPDTCFVDRNGDMKLIHGYDFGWNGRAQKYLEENDVSFSLSFGPVLIQDGQKAVSNEYPVGEIAGYYTRAAICQMDSLHYLYAAANVEPGNYHTINIYEFTDALFQTGCMQAYALDGGQTATVVMNNELMNTVNYGSQRRISDIIYFATAKPVGE